MVGVARGEGEVVERGEDGAPGPDERGHAVHQVVLVVHVEVGGGLVEEEEGGILCEGLREEHALLLAARERRYGAVRQREQVGLVERRLDAVALLRSGSGQPADVRREPKCHELFDRKVEVEGRLLADEGDGPGAFAGRPVAERATEEVEAARVGEKPAQRAQQRRLAAAVGAEQADPGALGGREGEVVQDRLAAERDAEALGAGSGWGRSSGHGNRSGVGGRWAKGQPAPPMIRTTLSLLALACTLSLVLVACDALDAQAEFENAASLPPQGIFRTTDGVSALNGENDPDDWRTAPLYAFDGTRVTLKAHPNPARLDDNVILQLSTGEAIPGGVRIRPVRGQQFAPILQTQEVSGPGVVTFSFFPGEIVGAQPGDLWRLIVFDGRSNVVTYGDLQIAP